MNRACRAAASLLVLGAVWLLAATSAAANEPLVLVVVSEQGGSYAEATEALLAELAQGGVGRSQVAVVSGKDASALARYTPRLAVALGSAAAQALADSDSRTNQLYALLPRATADPLLAKSHGRRAASAVYLDQPYSRQFDLLRLALPDRSHPGVLWGAASQDQKSLVTEAAAQRGLHLVSGAIQSGESLYSVLQSVLAEADVLVAVPEPGIWNSSNIQNILLASFRARVPLLAFSPAYVKAGALLALYATPAQIGTQAGGIARTALQGRALPAAQYPARFTVQVNGYVARALGLRLDEADLAARLRDMEQPP